MKRLIYSIYILTHLNAAYAQQVTTWQYGYDAQGNLIKLTDPRGIVTNQTVDALQRINQIQQPAPVAGTVRPIINIGYNNLDHVTNVKDPRALTTAYTVDGLSNQTQLQSPDSGITANTFDEAGNVLTRKDARLKNVINTYDALNRITKIDYPSGVDTLFEYDGGSSTLANAKGRLTKTTDEAGTTSYRYDGLGRLLSKVFTPIESTLTNPKTQTIAYTYGAPGQTANTAAAFATGKRTRLTYPSGNRINISYNSAGHITSLTLNPSANTSTPLVPTTNTAVTINLISSISYQPFDGIKGWTWGNGKSYTRNYDLDGRITRYPLGELTAPGSSQGVNRTLSYDAASRVTRYTHTSATGIATSGQASLNQTFTYDDLNRLIQAQQPSAISVPTYLYKYDANGNRVQTVTGSSLVDSTIDPNSNRLTKLTNPVRSLVYDAAGHLTSDGSGTTLAYSDRGRLSQATIISGTVSNTISYVYNAWDQRFKKSGPTTLIATGAVYYAYDDATKGLLLGEYDASLKPIQETVYLNDIPVAVIKQAIAGSGTTQTIVTSIYNVYADHLNAPRVITKNDAASQIIWRWDGTEPFGLLQANENPTAAGIFKYNLRFPGQVYDAETKLSDNWHRTYSPQLGRYVQSDPIGLQGGVNTYNYVGGDPVNSVDPLGLQAIPSPAGLIIGGLGMILSSPPGQKAINNVANGISRAIDKVGEACKSDNECPPCKTVSGKTVPVGTIGYRHDLVPPSKPHYPYEGDHYNLYKANQSPSPKCFCFWQSIDASDAAGGMPPPAGSIPIEHFAN